MLYLLVDRKIMDKLLDLHRQVEIFDLDAVVLILQLTDISFNALCSVV